MSSGEHETLRLSRSPAPGAGSPEPPLPAGTRVGEYEVRALIGAGSHGSVYLAEHRVLGRRAALKVLHREVADSEELVARFLREARTVNQVAHPGIVDIYDIGALPDGRPFCVMELLGGWTLQALLAERAPLPPAEAIGYLEPLCQALEAAHAVGVVHRDVKASNVMIVAEGHPPRVKLLDFGVAKVLGPGGDGLTAVGQRIGTPSSMAPEQIRGEAIDARTDVYALGVLLFQMLTGRRPFEGDIAEVERLHLDVAPPPAGALAPVPPALEAVVARALEKSPERRWPSALAMLEAATAALAGRAGPTRRDAAVAVLVTARPSGPADPEALLAQADQVEAAEGLLRAAGFEVVLATAGDVLGVRLLPLEPGPAAHSRDEAVRWARGAWAALATTAVEVTVRVHVADAEWRETSGGTEVVGGPACDPGTWPPGSPGTFSASATALAPATAPQR